MYYNTTKENELEQVLEKTKKQDEVVIKVFNEYKMPLSPSQVLKLSKLNCPLTSIRRSITDLTAENKLVKAENKVTGTYGRPEYLWKLK